MWLPLVVAEAATASDAALLVGAARRRPEEPAKCERGLDGRKIYVALERDKRKRARPIPTGPERSDP